MSLASTAAEWSSDSNNSNNRKRVSTIRKSPPAADLDRDDSKHSDIRNVVPSTIDDTNTHNVNMSSRVNTLLSQLSSDDDGNRLANYEPIQKPAITINRTDVNDLLPQTIEKDVQPSKFVANDINLANLSNYNQTYNTPTVFQGAQPYYAKMGISSVGDDKLTEKINYMIHLLEQQQMEKTSNVTEEFILYILLGVFVIFTVDSFTRAGKYVR